MYLICACMAGIACRYNNVSKASEEVQRILTSDEDYHLFCPESLGGLPCPRPMAEIVGGDGKDVLEGRAKVMDAEGKDVTEAFIRGAEISLAIAEDLRSKIKTNLKVFLYPNSPSCGVGKIYDGTFTGTLREGNGVAAQLLIDNGFELICKD